MKGINQKSAKGFTLIELMIVVAIIGILAAIALPAYQDYTARTQASEAMSLSGSAKNAIALFYQNEGSFPTTSSTPSTTSLAATGKYGAISVGTGGVITYTVASSGVQSDIAGKLVQFTPDTSNNAIKWTCATNFTADHANKVPTGCAATGATAG